MAKFTFNGILVVTLLYITQALAYQRCRTTSTKTFYCDDGFYCCNDNLQCCEDNGIGVGAWVGIVIGLIIFKTVLICFCIRWCRARRYARQPVYVSRQPVVHTISGPPPYSSISATTTMSQQQGYSNAVAYTPKSPPPAYTAS